MKIIWAPLALERIEEISDCISYDSPSAASNWIDSLFSKVEMLKSNPEIGRVVPEIEIQSIREVIFGNYRIFYRYEKRMVRILTVRNFN
jgi:addiction module RelE/StbE family toxin